MYRRGGHVIRQRRGKRREGSLHKRWSAPVDPWRLAFGVLAVAVPAIAGCGGGTTGTKSVAPRQGAATTAATTAPTTTAPTTTTIGPGAPQGIYLARVTHGELCGVAQPPCINPVVGSTGVWRLSITKHQLRVTPAGSRPGTRFSVVDLTRTSATLGPDRDCGESEFRVRNSTYALAQSGPQLRFRALAGGCPEDVAPLTLPVWRKR